MTEAASVPPMIRMQAVDKFFGPLHVLKDINLEIPRGEVVVVLGPSGSGKSTIASLVPRLYDVDSGAVRLSDVDVRDLTFDSIRDTVGV
ncbi:ATP-binding cassette domain-containing protein, partial [Kibdelosporangium lantanae]